MKTRFLQITVLLVCFLQSGCAQTQGVSPSSSNPLGDINLSARRNLKKNPLLLRRNQQNPCLRNYSVTPCLKSMI